MKPTGKISDYLRGDRRGKDANRLEREALGDPFLYEALEGLTENEGNHLQVLERLSRQIQIKARPSLRWKKIFRRVGIGLAALALISLLLFIPFRQGKRNRVLPLARMEEKETLPGIAKLADSLSLAEGRTLPDSLEMEVRKMVATVGSRALLEADSASVAGTVCKKMPEPVCGYEAYYRYLRDSLVYPADALQEGWEGETKLSFVVNKRGRPSHIRVVQWISYSCNREAIRLLNEGPAWTYTSRTDTVYLTIPFHLPQTP